MCSASNLSYNATITAPPASKPIIPIGSPVGTAPPFEVDDELELGFPVAPLALLVGPPVVLATEVPPPSVVTCPVTVAVAAVALPVMAPRPWLPLAVKYKLIAVLLGA